MKPVAEYKEPSGYGTGELTEKRSRFIGEIWRVGTEEEAKLRIGEAKARFHDARHSCWCYVVREGAVLRYSDDGEPQGTAGQPMLEMLRRQGVENVCCVVTRYFGGIMLGPGGLARAYTGACGLALDDAGISLVSTWKRCEITCAYNQFDRVRSEATGFGGVIENVEYGESITVTALFAAASLSEFNERIGELTSGKLSARELEEAYIPVPLGKAKD